LYDAAGDRFFAFSINTLRSGIWVAEIERASGVLRFKANSDGWFDSSVSAAAPGKCHHIYSDQSRMQVYVAVDTDASLRAYQVSPGSSPILTSLLNYSVAGLAPHDAQPYGNLLLCSLFNAYRYAGVNYGRLVAFDLDNLSAPPTSFVTQATTSVHSSYYHSAPSIAPSLWIITENNDITTPLTTPNITEVSGSLPEQYPNPPTQSNQPIEVQSTKRVVYSATGHQIDQAAGSFTVHNLRGVGRTGFLAHYVDGISIVDLNDTGSPMQALYSYDTTDLDRNVLANPNAAQALLDGTLGAWDIFPHADSGLVYVSGGGRPSPGAGVTELVQSLVFRVELGHLNRYWNATVFPSASSASGLFPRLVNPYGPPRAGKAFILLDENAPTYPLTSGGQDVGYRFTLLYSTVEPLAQTLSWAPSFAGCQFGSGGTVDLALDLVSQPNSVWCIQNPINNATFVFPTVGVQGNRWFFQLIVEEMDLSGASPVGTGRFAASRGHWMGVSR